MSELSKIVSRCAGTVVLGCALAAVPVVTALGGAPAQSGAEPACIGSESIVDGTPTCVPAPTAPAAPDAPPAPVDSQQPDGGHH
ncbi:Uncharacterised protein [Mycolicibacterium flavescens]|nr:Uncharacterised protein [Mycolicibacterium flavescens]